MNKNIKRAPVLFLVFNRLDTTRKVFNEIKKARPKKLFVAADGPRTKEEKKKTDEVRKYILDNIDWKCELKTLFRKKNLGCRKGVSRAIDWFFDSVEEGIILEDDCLPNQSFFKFCEVLLEKYRGNNKIASINGYAPGNIKTENSYIFTKNIKLWGWASWSSVWKKIYRKEEKEITNCDPDNYIKKIFPNIFERLLYKKRFKDSLTGNVSTWEFPWMFGIIRKNMLNISSKVNLVENIGFSEEYTNTKPNFIDKKFMLIKRQKINFPLKHPEKIEYNKTYNTKTIINDWLRVILKKILFFI